MIRLDEVSIRAGTFRLEGISLEIPTGSYGVLMGSTGCGKTSVLEAVAGLRRVTAGSILLGDRRSITNLPPGLQGATTGTVLFGDRDVTNLPPGERGIGYVPQDGALFRTMTVRQHLAFALKLRDEPADKIAERVEELADSFRIGHLLNRRPAGLSGGEIQRVALGRALSFRPKYLLLDEPLSAVDETTRDSLIALLNTIRATREVTVLHITHSSAEARELADVRYRLANGRVERERGGHDA
ncbi:ABC transporter ATP-binding protein [Zavarzinella formosa]|uniref:ABC transporter ATP-binding protein n=1 Tax=Zavarzinella formosa TaxID=360055 RepID=UPI00031489C9|nr:ABC transporter ATP-binding protein [Zavarzinella formosa]